MIESKLKNWSCDQQGTFEHECEKPKVNLHEYPRERKTLNFSKLKVKNIFPEVTKGGAA